MGEGRFLSYSTLHDLLEENEDDHDVTTDLQDIRLALWYQALTDWPTASEAEELILILEQKVGGKLTYSNLTQCAESLSPKHHSLWEIEAIASVIRLFETYEEKDQLELADLFDDMTHRHRKTIEIIRGYLEQNKDAILKRYERKICWIRLKWTVVFQVLYVGTMIVISALLIWLILLILRLIR